MVGLVSEKWGFGDESVSTTYLETIVIVSWRLFHLSRGRKQPTYIGVTVHVLSTMDITVAIFS